MSKQTKVPVCADVRTTSPASEGEAIAAAPSTESEAVQRARQAVAELERRCEDLDTEIDERQERRLVELEKIERRPAELKKLEQRLAELDRQIAEEQRKADVAKAEMLSAWAPGDKSAGAKDAFAEACANLPLLREMRGQIAGRTELDEELARAEQDLADVEQQLEAARAHLVDVQLQERADGARARAERLSSYLVQQIAPVAALLEELHQHCTEAQTFAKLHQRRFDLPRWAKDTDAEAWAAQFKDVRDPKFRADPRGTMFWAACFRAYVEATQAAHDAQERQAAEQARDAQLDAQIAAAGGVQPRAAEAAEAAA